MSETGEKVQDTPLTIREHLDPDKHWIGETLAPPTQSEIEATIGTTAGPGESPFVARADHKHKLDNYIYPQFLYYAPPSDVLATTSASFIGWVTLGTTVVPPWATKAVLQVNVNAAYVNTSVTAYFLNVGIGSSTTSGDFGVIQIDTTTSRAAASFVEQIDLVGSGSQTCVLAARRFSGAGQMKAVGGVTTFTAAVWYKPI